MSQYFPKPYEPFGGDISVKVDLSNHAAKADIRNISHVDTSNFALKTNLSSSKSEVAKVISIDTSRFVLNTKYDTDKSELENKIPDTSGLVKKTDYNTKINEIESKIPDISNLATKTALTTVENKIPDVSNLVKKTDYNTKVTEIENKLNNHNHDKYITTLEFNTLAADVFNERLARANLVAKIKFDNTVLSLNSKIAANKTKNESTENELKKLKTFHVSYFIGKSHFEEDGTQKYLVF